MKQICFMLPLVLALSLVALAFAESCEHEWIDYELQAYNYAGVEYGYEQHSADAHLMNMVIPSQICKNCGETSEEVMRAGTAEPHVYKVTAWKYTEDEQSVEITYTCSDCAYQRIDCIALETICQGTASSCLWGGQCDRSQLGFMYEGGVIRRFQSDRQDYIRFSGVIEGTYQDGTKGYVLATREYCLVCGRPQMSVSQTVAGEMPEEWNVMPVYTQEEFLTKDMPSNLPYQVIDQLKEKASAT